MISFRRAKQDDAAALGTLHVASWHETYAGLVPAEMLAGLSVDARAAMWSKILADPEAANCAAVIVAEEDGRIIGFGSCGQQRDGALADAGFTGEFSAIYVLRSHQGRGIGRSIMAAMAQALIPLAHTSASLWVLRENNPARTFYEKLGGAVVAEKVDERPNANLTEVAYGWQDVSRLLN